MPTAGILFAAVIAGTDPNEVSRAQYQRFALDEMYAMISSFSTRELCFSFA